ncbi:Fic family protein [Curtobacterium sp. MCBD17_040]|uniref:Fic/DOC family protein n=1 Tax=Curtobacterium sp. MCBD17_040 TaxID=2175674 RepID=UPI000DA73B2D|nr:Fic family protein [Curtobacterium sp. MCBD17_040]WIB65556.1 Fic family protein [Curtobacterium sp. MCBD17_040]
MPEFADPYVDPGTGVLRNLVGARTQEELDRLEANLALARYAELKLDPVRPTGDEQHLREIHRRLFQDVYDWAGHFRTVEISKGGDHFAPVALLRSGFAFRHLAEANNLRNLAEDDFIDALAEHFEEVNFLHPFREGNGRTQRLFWRQLSKAAGHEVDLTLLTPEENIAVSRAAAHGDLHPLREAVRRCLVQGPPPAPRAQRPTPSPKQGRRPTGSPKGSGGQFTGLERPESDVHLGDD